MSTVLDVQVALFPYTLSVGCIHDYSLLSEGLSDSVHVSVVLARVTIYCGRMQFMQPRINSVKTQRSRLSNF